MQIRVNLKVFIIILFFLLTKKLELYIVLMLFAILHELGHLLVGIFLGFKPKKIEILPIGVCASFYMNCKNYNKKVIKGNLLSLKKIAVSIAGPIVSYLIGMFFWHSGLSIFNINNDILIYSNFIIAIFNLIPIYPLDGGRILKNVIHIFKGLENSYKYTNIIGNVAIILFTIFSSFLILILKNFTILIVLLYLWGMVIIQNKNYEEKKNIYKLIKG